MIITEATWDDVNLGVKTFEIKLNSQDNVEHLMPVEKEILKNHDQAYLLVRTPVNVPNLLNGLPDAGYKFIEAFFQLTLKKNEYIQPKFLARWDTKTQVREADSEESIARAFQEIESGMFDTDRISIDTNFGPDYAARRYTNWIRSLIAEGCKIHEVLVDDDPVGFFILKPIDKNRSRGILTGLYKKYENSGFGTLIMKKLNDTVWELGYNIYLASVVSNNLKALRSNLLFGSTISDIEHNYIKHLRIK